MYLNNCRLWYRKTLLRNYFLFFPTGGRARNRLGFITQPDSFLQATGNRPADTCLRCISVNQSDCSTGSALTDQGIVPPTGPKQGAQNKFHTKNSPYFPGLCEEEVDLVLLYGQFFHPTQKAKAEYRQGKSTSYCCWYTCRVVAVTSAHISTFCLWEQ